MPPAWDDGESEWDDGVSAWDAGEQQVWEDQPATGGQWVEQPEA